MIAIGAIAERGRIGPILVFVFIWSTIVYGAYLLPISHFPSTYLHLDYPHSRHQRLLSDHVTDAPLLPFHFRPDRLLDLEHQRLVLRPRRPRLRRRNPRAHQ